MSYCPATPAGPTVSAVVDKKSVLFVTLDSCRYDTFEQVRPRNLSEVGPLYRAEAPGTFTYGSHAAMFVGFTPGAFDLMEPYVNPKYARLPNNYYQHARDIRDRVERTGRALERHSQIARARFCLCLSLRDRPGGKRHRDDQCRKAPHDH